MSEDTFERQPQRCRALLGAVLITAIFDAQGRDAGASKHDKRYALRWLTDEEDDDTMSFAWVCEQLGLLPDEVRRNIMMLLEQPKAHGCTKMPRLDTMSILIEEDVEFAFFPILRL